MLVGLLVKILGGWLAIHGSTWRLCEEGENPVISFYKQYFNLLVELFEGSVKDQPN